MDATLNIIVRVATRQAVQQLNTVASSVNAVNAASAKSASAMALAGKRTQSFTQQLAAATRGNLHFAKNIADLSLIKFGKNINWVGRQLTYNFTLPLALLGGALFKFNKDIEASMVQVRKVYGDLTFSQQQVKEETDALAESFELLSTRFGVHQREVIDIASAWASAGSAGRGLAENTRATLEAMILGEMEAAEATEALIAIQATWKLSTYDQTGAVSELTKALAVMNIVENETGIRMQGVIDVFVRAGGAARAAGVTIQELAAFSAALVPATGSAIQAGNALKTIFSRLQAPTTQVIDLLAEIGFTVSSEDWLGKTVTQKLQSLAGQWGDLSTAQRTYASSVLASRWQVNRFDVLMADMAAGSLGYYQKALNAANDEQAVTNTYYKELNTVLESSPRRWDIMTTAIQNTMSTAFLPLMPVIFDVVNVIRQLAQAFADLDPNTQKIILYGLAIVAVVGPVLSLIGSVMQLAGTFIAMGKVIYGTGLALKFLAVTALKAMGIVTTSAAASSGAATLAISWPVVAAIAAIAAAAAAIVLILKTDVEEPFLRAFENIVSYLARFPKFIADVFSNVIRVLARSIEIVIDLLSYLNPFARHSPSLVDNVRAGIDTILNEYDRLRIVPSIVAQSLASLSNFKVVSATDVAGFRQAELQDKVSQITAVNPIAGNAAAGMVTDILKLEAVLPALTAEIAAQEIVVARLADAYEKASAKVEKAEEKLSAIRDEMSRVSDEINEAKNKLNELANTPIEGMGAMEDAIFANSMAQKELNLQLLEFEKRGYSIDTIRNKMAALNGDMEMLQADKMDLLGKGAGSDILGVYDDQIAALEAQRGEFTGIAGEIDEITKALDALDLEGRILELQRSLTFDPLLREIDKLVNGVKEMSFDDIVAGIIAQQGIIDSLSKEYDDLVGKEKEAVAVVDEANAARDEVKGKLDIEQERLDGLKDAYNDILALVREMESSMDAYISGLQTAKSIADAAKSGADDSLFAAAEGIDYPIAGGQSILGAEGTLEDIEAFNEELQAEIEKMFEEMGNLDLLAGVTNLFENLKQKFNGFVQWIKDNWVVALGAALTVVAGVAFGPVGLAIAAAIAGLVYVFMEWGPQIWQWTYDNIVTPIGNALSGLATWLTDWVVNPIVGFFTTLGELLMGLWDNMIWPVIDLLGTTIEGLATIFTTSWEIISDAVVIAWDVIVEIWDWFYESIVKRLIPVVELFVVTSQIGWELISLAVQAAWDIISYIFGLIWEKAIQPLMNQLGWLWDRFYETFTWIGEKVNWLHDIIFEPVFGAIESVVSTTWTALGGLFDGFREMLNPIQSALRWLYDRVIKPILSAIASIFGSVWNNVISIVQGGVNFFIKGFNLLADGVNAVAGLLGIGSRISPLAELDLKSLQVNLDFSQSDSFLAAMEDQGGRRPGGGGGVVIKAAQGGVIGAMDEMGGVTNQMRALVGEGSNTYPEYVIPTDPRYRDNAKGLYNKLGETLGMGADGYSHMDLFGGISDIFNKGKDIAGGAVGAVGGVIKKGAVLALWKPLKFGIEAAMNLIPVEFIKKIGKSTLNAVDAWVSGGSAAWDEEALRRVPKLPDEAGPGTWGVILQMLRSRGIPYKFLSGFRPGAVTRNTGQPSWHGKNRAVDIGSAYGRFPESYSPAELLNINHAIYDAYKPRLLEMIYGGPGAKNVFRGKDHTFSSALMREHINHVHVALARGGFVVPRTPGGSIFRIGEGMHDEAVQVTPLHGQSPTGEGGRELNFYGDLSFPNITNGDDAEEFLRNLEALAL